MIDYKAANAAFKRQKGALTRAVNSKDPEKVRAACAKAVAEWSRAPFDGAWPDEWSRWQRALDDVHPWHARVLLEDLAEHDPRTPLYWAAQLGAEHGKAAKEAFGQGGYWNANTRRAYESALRAAAFGNES